MNEVVSPENPLFIHLYFLQVVDNTFITYWRKHLPVHVAFKLELCCFPFELVPPHVFISKDAVLLIITEWPTLMSSLTSLTFHFPTSHEPKRWPPPPPPPTIHVPSVNLKRSVSVSLFLTFPTDMDKILLVFPLYQQNNMFLWIVSLIPSLQSVTSHSLKCTGYEFRIFLWSDVHSLVNQILCSVQLMCQSFKLQRNKNFIQCLNLFLSKILPRMVIYFNNGLIYHSELVETVLSVHFK